MQVPDGIFAGTRSRIVDLVVHPDVHQIDSGYGGEDVNQIIWNRQTRDQRSVIKLIGACGITENIWDKVIINSDLYAKF